MIGSFDETRREATVIGAGIAGLLAAYALDRQGYEVTLLEGAARAGGLIQTRRNAYGIAETAAHSLLITPQVAALCRELGVELTEVRKSSRARFILRAGKLRKFPLTFGEAADALKHAAFARGENHLETQDLETWGRRHLGAAAVEYLLTPFVRGIYGVQPCELGLAAAFPELAIAPSRTLLGTMLRKALRGSKKHNHAAPHDQPKERRRMVAPRLGMGDLATRLERRLEARLGARFRRGVRVSDLPDAPNLVIATPADSAAQLLATDAPALSQQLHAIKYTPLVTVTAFVARDSFTRPINGVGVLAAASEARKCLGILFNSSAFAGRVQDETRHASFTLLFGGSAQPHWLAASDEEIALAVRAELADILGVCGAPLELVITRQPRGVPQYSAALPQVWQTARATWCAQTGHVLFGNYTGQVSLRGMIERAQAIN
ncbi:MAG TPA: protoporphyrinogen oxidase [Pyrinomonadaceae bacterium]|nr:protoporphyrinogen oxidase [Pyrinomonadaceae bacterium]